MHDSAQAIRERALAESQQSAAEEPHADAGHSKADVGSEPPTELPDPAQWQAGYLQIIDQVEIVNAMTLSYGEADEQTEFSVCRVPRGSLSPQDWGIVTPLPGIKGDGSDPVRVAIEQMKRDEFSRSQTQQSGL